mmetsp:Transcript_8582/g.16875  ORF Transcript_8582/g.16875 Transcript_8582/m.16875 type:complete len:180 (-) Transcript_8582:161-700(-)
MKFLCVPTCSFIHSVTRQSTLLARFAHLDGCIHSLIDHSTCESLKEKNDPCVCGRTLRGPRNRPLQQTKQRERPTGSEDPPDAKKAVKGLKNQRGKSDRRWVGGAVRKETKEKGKELSERGVTVFFPSPSLIQEARPFFMNFRERGGAWRTNVPVFSHGREDKAKEWKGREGGFLSLSL